MKFTTTCIALFALPAVKAGIIDAVSDNGNNAVGAKDRSSGHQRGRKLTAALDLKLNKPTQTFFIPLPEADVFENGFKKINDGNNPQTGLVWVRGKMVSLLSVAISVDKTIIYYDHWEDGYEKDATNPQSRNTGIWGDGKASNGCRPDVALVRPCTDADDVLNAGDSFVIESKISVPRNASNWFSTDGIKIDGGDRLEVNFPVTITRGMYAEEPGSVLAGGTEVHDCSKWGTEYEAPVGNDFKVPTEAFDYTRLFLMSASKDNIVTLPNGSKRTLNMGETFSVDVKMGDKVTSTMPLQVNILTGDPGSTFEMRWFSLLPSSSWSESYVTAVGDSFARTKVILYNPSSKAITATVKNLDTKGKLISTNISLPSRVSTFTHVIPSGSGALIESPGNKICALSVTDTELYTDKAGGGLEFLHGQAFDWGYALQPLNQLTSQVLVGWGYGCTANDCLGKTSRSAVFVVPIKDADVYIDFQNTGKPIEMLKVNAMQSVLIRDTKDHDMSGAIIFAVARGTGPEGIPVDFASAWGQDPSVSRDVQAISMDLGTTVLPFPTVRSNMEVDKTKAATGDILTYTINVQNVGQTQVSKGAYKITDPLPVAGEYIIGSLQYSIDGGKTFVTVDVSKMNLGKTPFPLDEDGFASIDIIPRRGGLHQFKYQLRVVQSLLNSRTFINNGFVKRPFGPDVEFEAVTELFFDPLITVSNGVYVGNNGATGCTGAVESVSGMTGVEVTYCFTVKNTGNTDLTSVTLSNAELGIAAGTLPVGKLAVGETKLLSFKSTIQKSLNNTATVEGVPVYANGTPIPNQPKIASTDPSSVLLLVFNPAIKIDNTVYKGLLGINGCSDSVEKVVDASGTDVTHCFKITNTGNTFLSKVAITNKDISYTNDSVINLAPGASTTVTIHGEITGNAKNEATVTAVPTMSDGTVIPKLAPITASDLAELGMIVLGTVRTGGKDRPIACMQNAWEDAGNSAKLICRAKEVYLSKFINPPSLTCNEGETITVSLKGLVYLNSDRLDPGWYVATDGGDALTGFCAAQAFVPEIKYTGATVTYTDGDRCGDVSVGKAGGAVEVPFIQNQTIKCVDQNNDYNLDFSVCFSWRHDKDLGTCGLTRETSKGVEIDLFPSSADKCFCTRYDVDTIKVVKPQANDAQSVC